MIKRVDRRLITLFCSLDKLVHFAEKSLKGGAPSAKMKVRADIGLKTLFSKNLCALLKSAKKWWAQGENDKSVVMSG